MSAGRELTVEADWSERLRDALSGREDAYVSLLRDVEALTRKVAGRLLSGAMRCDALIDDIAQETMLAVHVNRGRCDHARPVRAWVATIARNKTIDAIRRSRAGRSAPIEDHEATLAAPVAEEPGSGMDLERLLSTLRPRQREMVRSICLEGESVSDWATRAAMTEGAVRVAIHRAVRAMGESVRRPASARPR